MLQFKKSPAIAATSVAYKALPLGIFYGGAHAVQNTHSPAVFFPMGNGSFTAKNSCVKAVFPQGPDRAKNHLPFNRRKTR
ncbi:hypothetical protein [Pontibacter harenae]|uniref:hypothetical protein n=1 Tax=Pontibacter harenae TaxID=2894083 RepID=UPI001E36ADA8|nr:hypothetical protein [Pontibacter harenae]MCC9167879.1 hypothetical protein [Pontibacter harenae]